MATTPALEFPRWGNHAETALDALAMKPTRGVPHWLIHVMEISEIEHFADRPSGDYLRDTEGVYLDFQRAIGSNFIDQYIPDNPLTLTPRGLADHRRGATTGAEETVLDGITIDSPEAVCEHLERFAWPVLRAEIAACDPADRAASDALIQKERAVQEQFGPDLLKVPYSGFGHFPVLRYGRYGYAGYFMAYALYPEVIEKDFALQADLAVRKNTICAQAYREGGLPRIKRLDHDMADSRGTLVRIESLDRLWFPHFARSIRPLLDAEVRLLWHCDGNLMAMVPRLIEAGIRGFQGFQYEDGMDYERTCRMTDRDGGPLMIWGGVSVTRTLPHGTPAQVRDEINWLVRHGPPVGFFLGGSSSVAPGVPRENLAALFEGLRYYQEQGRSMQKVYRVGILGFGFIGKVHAYGYLNLPLFYDPVPLAARITHVCTSRSESAKRAAAIVGAEFAVTDFRQVTENPAVDIVHICTPNHLHKDALLSAIAHNKHIYCDKPLVVDLAEARLVEASLAGYTATAQMTFQNRFFPATMRARQLVEAGLLGQPLEFRASYLHAGSADPKAPLKWKLSGAAGGGVIADLASHVLDLVHWLLGDFEAVMAATKVAYSQRPATDDPARLVEVDAEDCVMLLARMQCGAMGTIEATKIATGSEDELRIEIRGCRGALRFNAMDPHHLEVFDATAPDKPIGGTRGWTRIDTGQRYPAPASGFPSPKASIGWLRSHQACLASFLEAVAAGRAAQPDLRQGIYVQRVMEAIRESARQQRWVSL